jgi:hypothetical protein
MAKVILEKLVPSNSPIYRQPLQIGGCFGNASVQIVKPIKKREPKTIGKPKKEQSCA